MSTRSLISIEQEDGKFKTIYCHSDGYLEHNGALLIDHYKEREKIEELLALGDISILAEKVHPNPELPHSFGYDDRQENVVVAYHRDRGETGVEAKVYSEHELLNQGWIDYVYVFTPNDEWLYYNELTKEFESVSDGLDNIYKSMKIKRPVNRYGYWTDETIKEERKRQKQDEMD